MKSCATSAVIVVFALATAAPAQTGGAAGQPNPLRPQPRPPTPEEREAIGLAEPTWIAQGKVAPEVREEFENQRKREEEAGGMADYVSDYHPYRPGGFRGMTYVAVYLKNDETGSGDSKAGSPGLAELQQRVLSRLTAAEFALRHAFKDRPAMLGYVSADGLAKLEGDPEVLAVGLDHNLPPVRPREVRQGPRAERAQWGENGKIDPEVAQRLRSSADGVIYVLVGITHVSLAPGNENDLSEMRQRSIEWQGANREIQDRVLSTVSAAEFQTDSRTIGLLAGFVSASGLAKLARHPDVLTVSMNAVGGLPEEKGPDGTWGPRRRGR
jgi:hypothetical protein